MSMKKHGYHLEGLMALLLFGVFAVCLLMVLFTGADSYQGMTRREGALRRPGPVPLGGEP